MNFSVANTMRRILTSRPRWAGGLFLALAIGVAAILWRGDREQARIREILERYGWISWRCAWPLDQVDLYVRLPQKWIPTVIVAAGNSAEEPVGEFLEAAGRCPWLRSIHLHSSFLLDRHFTSLCRAERLEDLTVWNATGFTGEGLGCLPVSNGIRFMDFEITGFSDAGAAQLHRFPHLLRLSIPDSVISDAGLAELARLPKLQSLQIGSPQFTAEGIQALAACRSLRTLELVCCDPADENPDPVSRDALQRLERAMPWCDVADDLR